MRSVCVLAARNQKEAEAMASVLQVISAMQRICPVVHARCAP